MVLFQVYGTPHPPPAPATSDMERVRVNGWEEPGDVPFEFLDDAVAVKSLG